MPPISTKKSMVLSHYHSILHKCVETERIELKVSEHGCKQNIRVETGPKAVGSSVHNAYIHTHLVISYTSNAPAAPR